MKQQVVAGILAVSIAGGVGTGVAFNQFGGGNDGDPRTGRVSADPTSTPTPSADPTTKSSAPAEPSRPAALRVPRRRRPRCRWCH